MKPNHRKLLIDLLTLPTAPFCEQHVIRYIADWVSRRPALRMTQDRFGNLQIRLRRGMKEMGRPLVLAAHMDHPGFEALRMLNPRTLRAYWRGGVANEYFVGTKVRFFAEGDGSVDHNGQPAGTWIRGTIQKIRMGELAGRRRVYQVDIAVSKAVPVGSLGMWDLPDPTVKGTVLHARGCDDVAGVAAVLAALDELTQRKEPTDVIAMLNRAEEVGFSGAIAACRERLIPRQARMVSVECSSELAGGKMGEGPILRVGDATAIFTPELTALARQVGQRLAASNKHFRFQRKLMDGGTCEGAAFLGYGYRTTGLCIALGNYHNMDRRRERIASEYVDLRDWEGMVQWFVALALAPMDETDPMPELTALLGRLDKEWTPVLEKSAARTRLPERDDHA